MSVQIRLIELSLRELSLFLKPSRFGKPTAKQRRTAAAAFSFLVSKACLQFCKKIFIESQIDYQGQIKALIAQYARNAEPLKSIKF